MGDDALKAVLDRKGVADSIQEHLLEPVGLLDDLVDYGTNLIARAYGSSPRDIKAQLILFVHLQQFSAHLDAVAVLLRKGCCLSAHLQNRTLLENLLKTKWILDKDTDNKIQHLFVANLRRRRQMQAIAVPGSPEEKGNPDAAGRITATPAQRSEIANEIAQIDQLLADPVRSGVNASFNQYRVKRGFDPHWYELCGAKSIRAIAKSCGREKDYEYVYSPLSGVIHGGGLWDSIIFRKNAIEVNPLRQAEALPGVARIASNYAIEIYRLVLTEYRYAELENFNRKYLREWRVRFRKCFNIKLDPRHTQI